MYYISPRVISLQGYFIGEDFTTVIGAHFHPCIGNKTPRYREIILDELNQIEK